MRYNATKIFHDLLQSATKKIEPSTGIMKDDLSSMDILNLSLQFSKSVDDYDSLDDYRHKNYDQETIMKVLKELREFNLTISEVANQYKISRNTISKWVRQHEREGIFSS
jgi:hypothetical protein